MRCQQPASPSPSETPGFSDTDDDFTLSSEDEHSETENDIQDEQAHTARCNTSSKRITTYSNLCEGKPYFCSSLKRIKRKLQFESF